MKISQNFKNKALKAKSQGYNKVYSLAGAYFATTYVDKWDIDSLIDMPDGSSVRAIKAGGGLRWRGLPTLNGVEKDEINYSELMERF